VELPHPIVPAARILALIEPDLQKGGRELERESELEESKSLKRARKKRVRIHKVIRSAYAE
jgi:hypothetical protein